MEIAELNIPLDGILYTSKDVKLKIEDTEISNGVVYITERSFSWKPEERAEGISIPWPQISLHAIQSQPVPSIYIMVDSNIVWPGVYDGNENGVLNDNNVHDDDDEKDEGNESDDENPPTTLMWLRPKDPNTLDIIFQAMQKAQSLNPDPTSDRTSDEEDEFMEAENIDEEDEFEEYEDVGQGDMRNLHIDNEDKFADAEEE